MQKKLIRFFILLIFSFFAAFVFFGPKDENGLLKLPFVLRILLIIMFSGLIISLFIGITHKLLEEFLYDNWNTFALLGIGRLLALALFIFVHKLNLIIIPIDIFLVVFSLFLVRKLAQRLYHVVLNSEKVSIISIVLIYFISTICYFNIVGITGFFLWQVL